MNPPIAKLTKEERKAQSIESSEIREKTYTLVAKIISWKTGARDSIYLQTQDKITEDEWEKYRKHLLNISKSETTKEIEEKLTLVQAAIKKHDGFE